MNQPRFYIQKSKVAGLKSSSTSHPQSQDRGSGFQSGYWHDTAAVSMLAVYHPVEGGCALLRILFNLSRPIQSGQAYKKSHQIKLMTSFIPKLILEFLLK